jgi:hypothetical protein
MSNVEQIYALLVEANPVTDVESLPEAYQQIGPALHAVPTDLDDSERFSSMTAQLTRTSGRRAALAVAVAAMAVLVIGIAAMLVQTSRNDAVPPATGPSTPTTQAFVPVTPLAQAETFIARLDMGDVDGAIDLLADSFGSIWFPPIGQVTDTEDVRGYLDFYSAIGMTTDLADCTTAIAGPSTTVTCQVNQQSEVLVRLGLDFPVFPLQFQVWADGIRVIQFGPGGASGVSTAFNVSRFFEFRTKVLVPAGLVQESGDPIWSRTNGELMKVLIAGFLADNP